MNRRASSSYYGPCLVALCFFLVFVSASVYMHTAGVFASEQIVAFGITRAELSLVFTGVHILGAFFAPLLGYLFDRYGVRNIMLFASAWLATGFLALARTDSVVLFAVLLPLFVGTGQSAVGQRAASQLLVHRFDRRRAFSLGVMIAGASVAGIAIPPVAVYLLDTLGWRGAYKLFAAIYLLLVLPLIALVVKQQPPRLAREIRSPLPNPLEPYRAFAASAAFWRAVILFGLMEGALAALNGHLFLHYTELGIAPYHAAAIMSATAGAALACKPLAGWFVDRVGTTRAAHVITAACAAAMAAFAVASTYGPLLATGVLFGLAFGGIIPLQATTISRLFDPQQFGRAYGSLRFCTFPISSVCIFFIGWIYDKTNSYVPGFIVFAVVFVVAVTVKAWRIDAFPEKALRAREMRRA